MTLIEHRLAPFHFGNVPFPLGSMEPAACFDSTSTDSCLLERNSLYDIAQDIIETLFPFSRHESIHAGILSQRYSVRIVFLLEDARTVTRTVINGTRFLLLLLLLPALDTAPSRRPTVDVVLPPFSPRGRRTRMASGNDVPDFLVHRINDA